MTLGDKSIRCVSSEGPRTARWSEAAGHTFCEVASGRCLALPNRGASLTLLPPSGVPVVSLDLPECTVLRVERVSATLGLCASPVGSDSLGTTAGRGFCTGDMTRCDPWGLLGGCKVMPSSWLWVLFSSCETGSPAGLAVHG